MKNVKIHIARHEDFQSKIARGPMTLDEGNSLEPIDWAQLKKRYEAVESGSEKTKKKTKITVKGSVNLAWVSWSCLASCLLFQYYSRPFPTGCLQCHTRVMTKVLPHPRCSGSRRGSEPPHGWPLQRTASSRAGAALPTAQQDVGQRPGPPSNFSGRRSSCRLVEHGPGLGNELQRRRVFAGLEAQLRLLTFFMCCRRQHQ